MPVRALRQIAPRGDFEIIGGGESESINARKGIKTDFSGFASKQHNCSSESINARKGIKTQAVRVFIFGDFGEGPNQ